VTQRLLSVQKLVSPTLPYVLDRYTNINSTKPPSSGAGNGREQVNTVLALDRHGFSGSSSADFIISRYLPLYASLS